MRTRFGFRSRSLARRHPRALADAWPALRPPESNEVLLLFGGDTHFEGGLRRRLEVHPNTLLTSLRPLLSQGDCVVVNLETSVCEHAAASGVKDFHFRAPPACLDALEAAGVGAVSMANNHALDCGPEGLVETLAALERSPIRVAGLGADASAAFAPVIADVRGRRIAFLAICDGLDRRWMYREWPATERMGGIASAQDTYLLEAVAAARAVADTVVVLPHWGDGGDARARKPQRALAATLVDAGADVVVGSGSHRPYSAGHLGPAALCYGLGNFIWWRDGPGALLAAWVAGRETRELRWIPCYRIHGIPRPITNDAAARYVHYIQRNARRDGLAL